MSDLDSNNYDAQGKAHHPRWVNSNHAVSDINRLDEALAPMAENDSETISLRQDRDELYRAAVVMWGREYIDATDYLKSHIQHLRQKLGESADDATRIVNERGVGYRFVTSRT